VKRNPSDGAGAASAPPEYAVRRETICQYFDPPLPRSTFHDLVNKGQIIPLKGLRGFYKLNESLKRLGLREVAAPPKEPKRSLLEIAQLALTFIDPELFPEPSWMLGVEELDIREVDHAQLMADLHRAPLEELPSIPMKLAYGAGVLDGQWLLEKEGTLNDVESP
jgi:hypothetical protein